MGTFRKIVVDNSEYQGSLPAQQRPPRGFSGTASEHKFKPAIVRFPDNTTVQ